MLAIHRFYFTEVKKLLSDIVKDFSEQLVEMLPMDDVTFINILDTHELFPNNSNTAFTQARLPGSAWISSVWFEKAEGSHEL